MVPALMVLEMVVAALLVLTSLVGSLGLCLQLKGIFKVYTELLTFAMVLTWTVAAESGIYSAQVGKVLENHIRRDIMWQKYGYPEFTSLSDEIDSMQNQTKCCGFRGAEDWFQARYFHDDAAIMQATRGMVPTSCCKDPLNCSNTNIFQEGCKGHLVSSSMQELIRMGLVSAGMACVQAVAIFMMLHVLAAWKKKDDHTSVHSYLG